MCPRGHAVTGRLGHLSGNAASVAGRRRMCFGGRFDIRLLFAYTPGHDRDGLGENIIPGFSREIAALPQVRWG